MSKDRVVDIKPVSQATRDRDLADSNRSGRADPVHATQVPERAWPDLKSRSDVLYMVEALAEGMAVLHVDVIRSMASGDLGGYERKLDIARAIEDKR